MRLIDNKTEKCKNLHQKTINSTMHDTRVKHERK
jgi:hypothetical protein